MNTQWWCPRREDYVSEALLQPGMRPFIQMDLFEFNPDPEREQADFLRRLLENPMEAMP